MLFVLLYGPCVYRALESVLHEDMPLWTSYFKEKRGEFFTGITLAALDMLVAYISSKKYYMWDNAN